MVWQCDGTCSGHGDCTDQSCTCDMGWFGSDCSSSGQQLWGALWPAYRGVFITAYIVVSCWVAYRLRSAVKRQTMQWTWRRMYRSPKYVSMSCLVGAGGLRVFWLSMDPYSFQGSSSRISDRLVYELAFPLLYISYTNVLVALYQGVRQDSIDHCRLYRRLLVGLAVLSLPASLTVSTLKGMRLAESLIVQIGYICVLAGVLVLISGLCLFAILLNRQLKAQAVTEENSTEMTDLGLVQEGRKGLEPTDRSIEAFLAPCVTAVAVYSKSKLYFPLSAPGNEEIEGKRPESKWSFSSVSQHSNPNSLSAEHNWSVCHSEAPQISPISQHKRPQTSQNRYIVAISDRDKSMLRQIIGLTVVSTAAGGVFMVILVVFSTVKAVRTAESVLAIFCFSSILEIAAFFMIAVIFTLDIQVKSKENLQFVSELARKMKDTKASLSLAPSFKHLAVRFQAYLGLEAVH